MRILPACLLQPWPVSVSDRRTEHALLIASLLHGRRYVRQREPVPKHHRGYGKGRNAGKSNVGGNPTLDPVQKPPPTKCQFARDMRNLIIDAQSAVLALFDSYPARQSS